MGSRYPGKQAWLTFGLLIAAGIGLVAAFAWKSHADVTKETIAPTASLKQISPVLEVMRQSLDALATHTATNQAQMMRSIDQLTAGQEHMTREITEMRTVERDILDKISTPTAALPKPALRPSQEPRAINPSKRP
jgi:tRNA C32,U32 (ribose-2'-O)-methylase TrmJ